MASTRSRNKFCLSLDNASSNTSSSTVHFNRWSEVVPPKTALTFAALWDPQEGMVTFSGAALLESESLSDVSPHAGLFDDDDDLSQYIAIDRDAGGTRTSDHTATLAAFQDALKALLHVQPWDSREHLHTKSGQSTPRCLQTRASSTFDGLDIYSHDVPVLKSKRSLQLSCMDALDMESAFRAPSAFGRLRLRSDLMLDASRSEESDASSGNRPSYLKSRFSTTTTSTSNYIDVTSSALHSTRLSETSPIPEAASPVPGWTPPQACASPAGSWPLLPRPRRLLRKRRPLDAGEAMTASLPSTPRKGLVPKPSTSSTPSSSASPATALFSLRALAALGDEEARRGQFPRPIGGLAGPGSVITMASSPLTPPPTPSHNKGPRRRLRLSFLPRRKRQPSPEEDGWVCIDVTPVIRQRYVADPEEDV